MTSLYGLAIQEVGEIVRLVTSFSFKAEIYYLKSWYKPSRMNLPLGTPETRILVAFEYRSSTTFWYKGSRQQFWLHPEELPMLYRAVKRERVSWCTTWDPIPRLPGPIQRFNHIFFVSDLPDIMNGIQVRTRRTYALYTRFPMVIFIPPCWMTADCLTPNPTFLPLPFDCQYILSLS